MLRAVPRADELLRAAFELRDAAADWLLRVELAEREVDRAAELLRAVRTEVAAFAREPRPEPSLRAAFWLRGAAADWLLRVELAEGAVFELREEPAARLLRVLLEDGP